MKKLLCLLMLLSSNFISAGSFLSKNVPSELTVAQAEKIARERIQMKQYSDVPFFMLRINGQECVYVNNADKGPQVFGYVGTYVNAQLVCTQLRLIRVSKEVHSN